MDIPIVLPRTIMDAHQMFFFAIRDVLYKQKINIIHIFKSMYVNFYLNNIKFIFFFCGLTKIMFKKNIQVQFVNKNIKKLQRYAKERLKLMLFKY